MRIAQFLRIALTCELELIAAAIIAAAILGACLLVDRSTELRFTVDTTVSGCSAPAEDRDTSGLERIGAERAPTTVRSTVALTPLAFLSDSSGSTATLPEVSRLQDRGCQILQVRTTGPDLSTAASVWFLAYVCLSLALLVVARARMSTGERLPQAVRAPGPAMQAVAVGIALGALVVLVVGRTVADALAVPAVVDEAISAFFGSPAFIAIAIVLAPLVEEIWFRQFWLERFARHHGAMLGSAFVTVMFCALHVAGSAHPLVSALSTAALSAACCIAYLRTRSIVPPVLLHASYNATIVICQS